METEWNKLTLAERAEFSVWRQAKQEAHEAKLRAAAEAMPKRYSKMSARECAAFHRKHLLPPPPRAA